uniref:Major facilitator superfamily associated domain-containing protein n=1 Tax=Timema cristinae TaxID=61476 RepID=A0A7R9CLF7_TIMCR|nr:unnamed protein product [Timema cristinae]
MKSEDFQERVRCCERATITAGTISSVPFLYGAGKITRKYGHVNIIIVAFFSHAARLIGYSFIENAWWCFPFEVIEAVAVHLMWIAAATYCALLAPKNLLATLIGVLGMAHFSLGTCVVSNAGLLQDSLATIGQNYNKFASKERKGPLTLRSISFGLTRSASRRSPTRLGRRAPKGGPWQIHCDSRGSGSFFGGLLIGTVGTRESFRIMGMLAIVGGITYGLLHYFWLRKVEAGNNSKEEQQGTAPRHWSLRRTHYTDTRHTNTKLAGALLDSRSTPGITDVSPSFPLAPFPVPYNLQPSDKATAYLLDKEEDRENR